jgi:steroid delta-isomerase-like uncharacterized protein
MKQKLFLSFLLVCITFTGFSNGNANKKIRQNEELGNSFIEALNAKDIGTLASLFTEDSSYEEVCSGRFYKGREAIANYIKATFEGIPDSNFKIVTIVADDKHATVEWIWTGTNTVGWPVMNLPATGKSLNLKGISIMDIDNGKIKSNRDYWDWNSFLKGIGAKQ